MIGGNYNRPTVTNMFHACFRSVLEVQFLGIIGLMIADWAHSCAGLCLVSYTCICCWKCWLGGVLEGKDDTEGSAVVTTTTIGIIKFICLFTFWLNGQNNRLENRKEAGGEWGMMMIKNCDSGYESNSNKNNKNKNKNKNNNPEFTESDCEKPR